MKRRNESKLPETLVKSSRIESKKEIKKKPPTKPELLIEYKAMKENYDHLTEENNKNIETIKTLKKELLTIKQQGKNASVSMVDSSTETEQCN